MNGIGGLAHEPHVWLWRDRPVRPSLIFCVRNTWHANSLYAPVILNYTAFAQTLDSHAGLGETPVVEEAPRARPSKSAESRRTRGGGAAVPGVPNNVIGGRRYGGTLEEEEEAKAVLSTSCLLVRTPPK